MVSFARGKGTAVGDWRWVIWKLWEMCCGCKITGEKLDGAEGMKGVCVSWINRAEDGA